MSQGEVGGCNSQAHAMLFLGISEHQMTSWRPWYAAALSWKLDFLEINTHNKIIPYVVDTPTSICAIIFDFIRNDFSYSIYLETEFRRYNDPITSINLCIRMSNRSYSVGPLLQIMVWCRTGDMPLSETTVKMILMWFISITYTCWYLYAWINRVIIDSDNSL